MEDITKMPKIQESIQKISGKKQYRITIPFEIMKLKGWNKGKALAFNMQMNGEVVLKEL